MSELSALEICLRKLRKVVLPTVDGIEVSPAVATMARNLSALGFGLSPTLMTSLSALDDDAVADWYAEVLPVLRAMVGADRPFEPMYPNFPRQVMEASDAELFFNAMSHYFGFVVSDLMGDPNFVLLPRYEKELRPLLDEKHELRWIDVGTEEEFEAIFTRLVSANGSLSEFDREVLTWFTANRNVEPLLPEAIPQKETLAFLVAALPDPTPLVPHIKTATDVLRVAVALSNGDVSLAEATRFRSFKKRERRFLLHCLEETGPSRTEDMLRWRERWKRLGERLHPGDFKKRYPNAFEAFDVLRNDRPVETFNSRVEVALRTGVATETVALLGRRPGDFARRLDHALRTQDDPSLILREFLTVAERVSTPVLLQAWAHFHHREAITERAFFPKGNAAKVQFQEGPLPDLSGDLAERAADGIRKTLVDRFAELPSLGRVYLDERLRDHFVPFAQRSASRSLRTITRGSTFPLPDGNTVRFFCWWKNIESKGDWPARVDLDLSVSMFRDDWELAGEVAYYNLRQSECYHSGDITSAPQGACEFIDVNIKAMIKKGVRYVVPSVLSFTAQPFLALPECFGGWMIRQKPQSGEIFEPKTVQDRIDITSASRACVPVIIDVVDRLVYWTDLGLKSISQANNAANNSVGFSQIGRAVTTLKKPTLHDLFAMHLDARGKAVDEPETANTVFGLREGTVTAFDADEIMSEYLV